MSLGPACHFGKWIENIFLASTKAVLFVATTSCLRVL